jgi:hypothetical protein
MVLLIKNKKIHLSVLKLIAIGVFGFLAIVFIGRNLPSRHSASIIPFVGAEVVSARTAVSKTYSLGSGQFAAVSDGTPLYYQNSQGQWQDIDVTIEKQSEDPSYDYQNKKNNFETSFKDNTKGDNVVKFAMGSRAIQFGLEDNPDLGSVNNSSPVVSGSTMTYLNVYDGVDLKYTVSSTQLLEEFIVASPVTVSKINSIAEQFTFSNVTYKEQLDGSIKFFDSQTNENVFTIPKPVMYELNNRAQQSFGLHYTITKDGDNYYITKVLDQVGKDWLSDPTRVYPVVIDTSTAATSPGTMADVDTVGTIAWADVNNAKSSDDAKATVIAFGTTHYLKATNFGFSIPTGATINGILVEIERRKDSLDGTYDTEIKIVKSNGSIGTTNKAYTTTMWNNFDEYVSYGSSIDLWGEAWTAEDINDTDFGVALSIYRWNQDSFTEDTRVLTTNGYKKISDIKMGEIIYSYNEKEKTIEKDKVIDVRSHCTEEKIAKIYLENGEVIKTTTHHKFYLSDNWVEAKDLKVGDELLNSKLEKIKIKEIGVVENYYDKVWNLSVKNNHNFFVNDVLVHNYSSVDHIRITVYYTEAPPGIRFNGIKMQGIRVCSSFGTCAASTKANGESCSLGSECTSTYCADSICCDTTCTGSTCQRCDSYSNAGAGTCGYISTAVDPDNECTASTNCGGDNCKGTGYTCDSLAANTSGSVGGSTAYCDNSNRLWTPTAIIGGLATTYEWGGYGTDEPSNSCINIADRAACNYCDDLSYAGYTDWVLPTKTVLIAFWTTPCGSVSCGPGNAGVTWDPNAIAYMYWSSTEYDSGWAWLVYFDSGYGDLYGKDEGFYVRCVRGQ